MKIYTILAIFLVSLATSKAEENIWHRQLHGFYTLNIASSGNNIIVSSDIDLLISSDGGANWTNTYNGINPPISRMCECGGNLVAINSRGIVVSQDNGWSWKSKYDGYCNSLITFGDTAIVQSGNILIRSTDKGVHWFEVETNQKPAGYLTVATRTKKGIVAGTEAGLVLTTDGGVTWWNEAIPSYGYVGALLRNGSDMLLVISNAVYRSTDGGDSWLETKPSGSYNNFGGMVSGTACAGNFYIANNTAIFCSTNGGADWTVVCDKGISPRMLFTIGNRVLFSSFEGLHALDPATNMITTLGSGLADIEVTSLVKTSHRVVAFTRWHSYRSEDKGNHWTLFPSTDQFSEIMNAVSSGSVIVAQTSEDHIVRSTDEGDTWYRIYPWNAGENRFIYGIGINGNDIYLIANARVMHSRDLGLTWQTENPVHTPWMAKLASGIGDTLFAIDGERNLYKSTDDGANWAISNINQQKVNSVKCIGSSVFVQQDTNLWESTNAGLDWILLTDSLKYYFNDLIINDGKMYIATSEGVFTSANGGHSWSDYSTGLSAKEITLLISDGAALIANAEDGGIYTTGAIEVSVEEPTSPDSFMNICPNPATEYITIPTAGCNEYRIVNIQGETVAIAKAIPGNNNITVDVSNLPCGVYFVASSCSNYLKFVKQ